MALRHVQSNLQSVLGILKDSHKSMPKRIVEARELVEKTIPMLEP